MKTVIEMAREAGFLQEHIWYSKSLEQFAELVRADAIAEEREACANVANYFKAFHGDVIADAIRARSNT